MNWDDNANRTLSVNFDYSSLESVATLTSVCPITGWSNAKFIHAAEGLNDILGWFAEPNKSLTTIGTRALCLAYVLRPELFPQHKSLASLARQFNMTRQQFDKHASSLFRLSHERFYHGAIFKSRALRAAARTRAIAMHRKMGHNIKV